MLAGDDLTRTDSLDNLAKINEENKEAVRKKGGGKKWTQWKYFLPPLSSRDKGEKGKGASEAPKKPAQGQGARTRSLNTLPSNSNMKGGGAASPHSHPKLPTVSPSLSGSGLVSPVSPKPVKRVTETFAVPIDHIPALASSAFMPGVCVELRCLRDENTEGFADVAAGKSMNLYPLVPGEDTKLADPICDYYRCQIYGNRALATVADGCGWGFAPANAALVAGDAFVTHVKRKLPFIADVRAAGQVILEGLTKAHDKIIAGFADEEMFKVGTTTLCGGILLEIDRAQVSGHNKASTDEGDEDNESSGKHGKGKEKSEEPTSEDSRDDWNNAQWVFLCAGVGDCKALHFSQTEETLVDITKTSRSDIFDSTDPGGRLGPYKGHAGDSAPDLRNLNLTYTLCKEGDLIIIITDGIYDNYDPYHRGVPPKSLGLNVEKWAELGKQEAEDISQEYMVNKIKETFLAASRAEGDIVTPKQVVISLTSGCQNLVARSAEFMEKHPNQRLPVNYLEYPGKMDHATCLAFRVGKNDFFTDYARKTV